MAYSDQEDLWLGLQTTFRIFQDERISEPLGAPPLNGDLFDFSETRDLNNLYFRNRDLLMALWHLSMYRESERTQWRRINYGALDVEELGSVYESLLDFAPYFSEQNGRFFFDFGYGTERKSTGSYYTPHELVSELVKSALVPVLEDRLKAAKTKKEKEKAILSLKVCDPAAGSGHFLLAAARRLGRELAKIRTGDDEPAPEQMRLAVRDCITHCIYGVDKNALAVDLCKVALWIEGHSEGKPLTFLDHRIRCGDSLIGVTDLDVLKQGIPDDAYKPMVGDDKVIARSVKQQNRQQRKGQRTLPFRSKEELQALMQDRSLLMKVADDTPEQIRRKAEAYRKSQSKGTKWWQDNTACHLWTAAFFAELTQKAFQNSRIPTTDTVNRYLDTHSVDARFIGTAWALAQSHCFFHWPLEFPEVFTTTSTTFSPLAGGIEGGGGFDCVLGNPPWERIKLQEKEFFAQKDPKIATAPNAAARKTLIAQLSETNPGLWVDFMEAKRASECESNFMRASGRYPLSAVGDINTYQMFAGLARNLISVNGHAGIVIPSGIATDDSNKQFFSDLTEKYALVSLYDFENREKLFPDVDSRMKFCLLTVGGTNAAPKGADFAFFLTNVGQMKEEDRHFSLSAEDIGLLNPNTRTCPIFRSKRDAKITKAIYRRVPVLIDESKGKDGNPWGIGFSTMFHMTNDSHLFRTREQLEVEGWQLQGNAFVNENMRFLPFYEAKMAQPYDHRAADVVISESASIRQGQPRNLSCDEHKDFLRLPMPRVWINEEHVQQRIPNYWKNNWLLGFTDVTSPTNERTMLATIIPLAAVANSFPLIFVSKMASPASLCSLYAGLNSSVFDFVCRQKIGGVHINFFLLKQLPMANPLEIGSSLQALVPRHVLELSYTAQDVKNFAEDLWNDLYLTPSERPVLPQPFVWDEERRFLIRCELDSIFFHLYGIGRNDVDYIMETFPIVKRKDEQKYGEYRTKRVILECYDAMAEAMETGRPYQTILDPPPADPRVAHQPKEA